MHIYHMCIYKRGIKYKKDIKEVKEVQIENVDMEVEIRIEIDR